MELNGAKMEQNGAKMVRIGRKHRFCLFERAFCGNLRLIILLISCAVCDAHCVDGI